MIFGNIAKAFLVLGALSLSACSSGGGDADSTTSTTPTPTASSGSYLFYQGSLHAVNPATPASPITIEAGTDIVASSTQEFIAVTYTAATKTVSDGHAHAIVYAKTDGKLYKASGMISGGTPTPTQLSSESAATQICDVYSSAIDLANPDNSQYVYRTPGLNTTCYDSDDVFKMVRLNMSATDAPVDAKIPITELNNLSSGALSGWLVNDAGELKRCDASFANCGSSLKTITSSAGWHEGVGGTNRLLDIDNGLYVYDGDANTLSAPIFSDNLLSIWDSWSDAGKFYFVNNGTSNSIYSAPIDGSAAATELIAAETGYINSMFVADNKIVYATDTEIKTAANPVDLTSKTTIVSSSGSVDLSWTTGNHIYYTTYTGPTQTGVPTAGIIDADGTNKTETPAAQWSGQILRDSVSFDNSFDSIFETILRTEGYEALGAGKGFGGGTLRSFNMASRAETAMLGTLPADVVDFIFCYAGFGHGSNALCQSVDSTPQTDIFFLNAKVPNSLVRVTNTPAVDEAPWFF